MRFRVLGCHGGETPRHRTTCFLINQRVAIDAGAICRSLPIDEQVMIDHILVSHSHMDHVKDLALLADQVVGRRDRPIQLHCGPETAATLEASYFNNYLWPDFTRIPTEQNPVLNIVIHEAGVPFQITDASGEMLTVTYVPVSHPIESMGMIVRDAGGAIVYSSDTGPTDRLWATVNQEHDVRAIFMELSFPNHMQALADVAGHFTPRTLHAELGKMTSRPTLFVYHLKPGFYEQTRDELMALHIDDMELVELTDEFTF
jgi:ribonuclease BN (tRNA processing enzyme)